jgi:hypothetical protein
VDTAVSTDGLQRPLQLDHNQHQPFVLQPIRRSKPGRHHPVDPATRRYSPELVKRPAASPLHPKTTNARSGVRKSSSSAESRRGSRTDRRSFLEGSGRGGRSFRRPLGHRRFSRGESPPKHLHAARFAHQSHPPIPNQLRQPLSAQMRTHGRALGWQRTEGTYRILESRGHNWKPWRPPARRQL